MELILSELQRLVSAKTLVKPEQAIFRVLSNISDTLLGSSDQSLIYQLNSALTSLLQQEKTHLSPLCSVFIGEKKSLLFKYSKSLPNDFEITSKSSPQLIISFGVLARRGIIQKSKLSASVKELLKVNEKNTFAVLYALRSILKTLNDSEPNLDSSIFNYIKKSLTSPQREETDKIAALKLLKRLALRGNVRSNQIMDLLSSFNNNNNSAFVRDAAQRAAASLAVGIILKSPATPSFDEVSACFKVFHEKATFEYFAASLGPSLMSKHSARLLSLFKDEYPVGIPYIISFCPDGVKYQLFNELIMREPTAEILDALSSFPQTQEVILRTANFAMKLYESSNTYNKECGSKFFPKFAQEHRDEAYNFICTWVDKFAREDCEEEDWYAAGSIISKLILSNPDKDSIIEQFSQHIAHIQNHGLNSRSVLSGSFVAAFYILSVAPEEIIDRQLVNSATKRVVDNIASNTGSQLTNLYASVLQFYMFHPTFEHAKDIALSAVKSLSTLDGSCISSLMALLPQVFNNEGKVMNIIQDILTYTFSLNVTYDLVANFVKKMEPEEFDVVNRIHNISKHVYNETEKATRLIRGIPKLILAAPKQQQKDIIVGIHGRKPNTAIQSLILIALINNDETEALLPRGFLIPLLKTLKGSDTIYLQATCETIAAFLLRKETFINATVKFIETNKSNASLFLLAALVNKVHLSNDLLVRLILCANQRTTMNSLRSTAIYATSCIILAHQQEIAQLALGAPQLTLLFDTLHGDMIPSPMVAHLVSETLIALIPTLVPEALEQNSPLKPAILSIIDTLVSTPMQSARENYFHCLNEICDRAFQFMDNLQLKYNVMNGASTTIKLLALEAYSKYISHTACTEQIFSFTKFSMQLLHETGSQYAKDFILAIARTFATGQQTQQLYVLCELIKNILINRQIPEIDGVAPSSELVSTTLQASVDIFSGLISAQPYQLDIINDILSSICYSTTSADYNQRVASFEALGNVYGMMKSLNNKKLTDHYFANLLTAAKIGFASGVESSGKFLSLFAQEREECLDLYSRQLLNIQVCSADSYSVAAAFCRNVIKMGLIEKYSDTLKYISPSFLGIVMQAISITVTTPDQLQAFTEYISPFFEDLASSFFYLLKEFEEGKNKTAFISLFVTLLQSAKDLWLVKASINAISSYAKLFPGEDLEVIEEGLEAIGVLVPQIGISIGKEMSDAVDSLTKSKELTERMWEIIIYIVTKCACKPAVYLRIVDHFTAEKFESFAGELIVAALNSFVEGTFNKEEIEAIYVIMLDKGAREDITKSAVTWCGQTGRIKLGFRLAEIAVEKYDDFDMPCIAEFAAENVRNGGLQFYINSKDKELELLARGGANAVFGFALGDSLNAPKYISLINDVLEKSDHKIDESVFNLCMNCITTWAGDKQTLAGYAKLLLRTKEVMGDKFAEIWESLPVQEKEACITVLESM